VASVSKQFTAFAVTLLADQGKLSLDDDIREYLPELHDFGTTITIRHLIHHTSGLRDQWTLLAMAGWRLDDVITLEHIMKLVRKQRELNFEPGAEHLYSNTGYTLLAEIVARVSGRSFREWTTKNIFEPLGMRQTHFHDDHELIVPHRAYSYGNAPGGFRKSVLSYANVGATSLFTTVEDLARWMRNLDDGKLGSEKVREQMHEHGVLNDGEELSYAFGLVHGEHNGLPTVSHGGADAGFRSFVTRYPEQGLGVVVLSNLGDFNTGSIATRIAEIYLADRFETAEGHDESPVEPEIASDTAEAEIDPALYDDYAGEYQIAAGFVISITREEDRLMGQAPGQPRMQLTPKSETRFAVEDLRADVTFERDESGQVNRLVLHQGDEETSAKRLEPFAAEQLDLYAGAYTSNELETTYTLVPDEGRLLARHMRHPDIELKPTAKDEFTGNQWFFGTLTFERDETNHITGFRLSSGRVRNLLFTRQERGTFSFSAPFEVPPPQPSSNGNFGYLRTDSTTGSSGAAEKENVPLTWGVRFWGGRRSGRLLLRCPRRFAGESTGAGLRAGLRGVRPRSDSGRSANDRAPIRYSAAPRTGPRRVVAPVRGPAPVAGATAASRWS
jgi:CubicO group peptidase (beta-lactamase class C family)